MNSKIVEGAVTQFSKLPGIGKKTALRLVLHLLKQDEQNVNEFSRALLKLKSDLHFCKICHNISDEAICGICSDKSRNQELVCVVEDLRDVLAIENTNHFRGVYHVLGGLISPMDGIGPEELKIESLIGRLEKNNIKELIFALSATMEGDTTTFYITKRMNGSEVKTSTISRGISVGGELEYADEITLGRSILSRVPYKI